MTDAPPIAPAADPRETTEGYRPPEKPEANEWWALALKFGGGLFLSALLSRVAGQDGVATAVIAAAFLVGSPPMAALRVTGLRVLAMIAGAALGTAGGAWGAAADGTVPAAFYAGLGVAVGLMAVRSATLIYTAAIASVVASAGAARTEPLGAVVADTCVQLVIGTVAALATVWAFETARAVWASRRG